MRLGIITPEHPDKAERRGAGIAGESMAAYWMNQEKVEGIETELFDPLDSFDRIKSFNADWYLMQQSIPYCHTSVMPNNCVKEIYGLPLIFWSFCSTPAQLIDLGKKYPYIYHNNYHFYSRGGGIDKKYIYAPLSAPLVEKNEKKNGRFLYVANYHSKTTEQKKEFLEPLLGKLDIYGSEHWASDPIYRDNYKGRMPLESFLKTYNEYSYSSCIHNDNNRHYGEFSLGYFLALSCRMSFYLDSDCLELTPVGDYYKSWPLGDSDFRKDVGREWLEKNTYREALKIINEHI